MSADTERTVRARGQHRRSVAAPRRADLPLATVVLLALSVVAAAFAVFFAVHRPAAVAASDASLTSPSARSATAAARAAVSRVLSYSYKSIQSDVQQAEAHATGLFLRQYRSTASQLLSQARQEKAIVSARVGQAGVVSAGPNDVVVLLFVDQATVRQPHGPSSNTTRIDQSRVRVTMTKVGSRWLISQLAAL